MRGILFTGLVRAGALGMAAALAACADSDDSAGLQLHDGPVPLAAKADVVRELRIVNYFVTYGDGEAQPGAPFSTAKRGTGREIRPKAMDAKAAAQCESGSGNYVDGTKHRDFELFAVSAEVDYTAGTLSDCRRTDVPGVDSVTYDGFSEQGASPSGEYHYMIAGDGRTPAVVTVEQDGAVFHQGVLGLVESRSTSALYEERQILRYNFDHDLGSAIVGEFGRADTPFIETDGGGRYTVRGHYRYRSTECEGGSVSIATDSPVIIQQGYPSGGTLRFTSGAGGATVVIRSDNGATIYFASGMTDSISGAEMRQIYDDFETECVLDRFAN